MLAIPVHVADDRHQLAHMLAEALPSAASFRSIPSANGIRELVISTFIVDLRDPEIATKNKARARAAYVTESPSHRAWPGDRSSLASRVRPGCRQHEAKEQMISSEREPVDRSHTLGLTET